MGYLGATLTQVFTHAWSGRVTQRCHNSPNGNEGYRLRVTSRTRSARRIWGILKKSVRRVELRTGHRTRRVDFRLLVEALGRCRTRWGADDEARIERI